MGMDLLREHDGFRLSQADTGSKSHDAGLILHLSADDPIGLSNLDTSRPASRLTHTLHVDGIGNDDLICQLMCSNPSEPIRASVINGLASRTGITRKWGEAERQAC
jgi:hypothetical protein